MLLRYSYSSSLVASLLLIFWPLISTKDILFYIIVERVGVVFPMFRTTVVGVPCLYYYDQ